MLAKIFRRALAGGVGVLAAVATTTGNAYADNSRLNNGVVANVYTIQHQAGCRTNIKKDPALTLAAQWHTNDVLTNRGLDSDMGSD
jgi:hypothetical protein